MVVDELEALYDAWWPTLGWGFANRRSGGYYRLPARYAETMPRLRVEPLTEKQFKLHRPDLPLRMCRHRTLNWARLACENPDQMLATAAEQGADLSALPDLATKKISLNWISMGGVGAAKHVEVSARDGTQLTAVEVLWYAQNLFASLGIEVDDGIGLFRDGFRRGVPSYYIGGYHDYAGTTLAHEEGPIHGSRPEWRARKKKVTGDYRARLNATKADFPFKAWRDNEESGLDQYSKENCAELAGIFNRLLSDLVLAGESASEQDKLEAFRRCVESLNAINDREMNLIESGERDELCTLCNTIADAAGLDPTKYAGGEGPASLWRDW